MPLTRRFAFAVVLGLLLPGPARADAALDWAATVDGATAKIMGVRGDRARAIAWLAAFNALDAIEPRFRPFAPAPQVVSVAAGAPAPAVDAALATALYTALVGEPDADHALLARRLAETLAAVKGSDEREAGVLLGREAALLLLLARAGDRLGRVEPPVREARAGEFVPPADTKMPRSLMATRLAPFAVRNVQQFDPGPPPALGSEAAARDVAEARSLGAMRSSTRSADQTAAALFWNSGEPGDFLALLKPVLEARKPSPLELARMMALDAIIVVDSTIVGTALKEKYLHWRPETAIAGPLAGAGRDAGWQALVRTPNSPDYPSGAGIAAGLNEVEFVRVFAMPGPIEWRNGQTGQARRWPDATAMADELAAGRVWAGVHFRSAVEAGRRVGRAVANDVVDRQLVPR